MKKQGSFPEKEIMQGTMPGARRRGRPRTAWMDYIKMWTGLSVEESIRMTEDKDRPKWKKYVHGVDVLRLPVWSAMLLFSFFILIFYCLTIKSLGSKTAKAQHMITCPCSPQIL